MQRFIEKWKQDKEARECAFTHDVPTRAYLHFGHNCQSNEQIIKNRSFSLYKSSHKLLMNYMIPCLIKALTRSHTINKTTVKTKQQNEQKEKNLRQKFNV